MAEATPMSEATPRPWHVEYEPYEEYWTICGEKKMLAMNLDKADAEMIVRVVHAFPELVAALEALITDIDANRSEEGVYEILASSVLQARTALEKARQS